MNIVDWSKVKNDKSLDEYPEDTLFVMHDSVPRYILEPFEIIPPDDPRYDKALTREQFLALEE